MAKYNAEKNYDKERTLNSQRKDFECPCCGKHYPLSEAELEKFELYRKITLRPSPGYLVYYGGYRLCPKCYRRRDWSITLPFTILKYGVIIAIISIIVAFIIDSEKYGLVILGGWLAIGTPLFILSFIIPYTVFHKYSKSFDFDKNLKKNAVDWNPKFKDE